MCAADRLEPKVDGKNQRETARRAGPQKCAKDAKAEDADSCDFCAFCGKIGLANSPRRAASSSESDWFAKSRRAGAKPDQNHLLAGCADLGPASKCLRIKSTAATGRWPASGGC